MYRADVAGGPYTQVAAAISGTSYLDLFLTNDQTYHYVVRAQDTEGLWSTDSGEASATPTATSSAPSPTTRRRT